MAIHFAPIITLHLVQLLDITHIVLGAGDMVQDFMEIATGMVIIMDIIMGLTMDIMLGVDIIENLIMEGEE